LGQLTGGVAHDFNNLLSVIQANLDLVGLSGDREEERAARLESAMSAVEHGASLTQYLLALSRKQALNPQPIDVGQLLTQTRSALERTLGKAIKVTINIPDDLWHCLSDRAQLESAVLNLALNARDAMSGGGEVRIDVLNAPVDAEYQAAHPDAKIGEYLMISVRDTGYGIPEDCIDKVWEPFFTTKRMGEATGLGLSTVYGFLKQSGGHVEINSEVGIGTEVRLYLPRSSTPARSVKVVDAEEAPMGAGEILLLVEDDAKLRELLTTLLDGLGYNVVNAADGPDALSIFDELPDVRLVLSDVMLTGGISGVELVKEIRARRPEVKVLLMSGYAAEEIERAGHRREEVELLTKPFTQIEFARKIRAALEESEAEAEGKRGKVSKGRRRKESGAVRGEGSADA